MMPGILLRIGRRHVAVTEPEPIRPDRLGNDLPAVRAVLHPQALSADRPHVAGRTGHRRKEIPSSRLSQTNTAASSGSALPAIPGAAPIRCQSRPCREIDSRFATAVTWNSSPWPGITQSLDRRYRGALTHARSRRSARHTALTHGSPAGTPAATVSAPRSPRHVTHTTNRRHSFSGSGGATSPSQASPSQWPAAHTTAAAQHHRGGSVAPPASLPARPRSGSPTRSALVNHTGTKVEQIGMSPGRGEIVVIIAVLTLVLTKPAPRSRSGGVTRPGVLSRARGLRSSQ